MTVAANIIKQFVTTKFEYLGAGFYACVFASKNPNLVYKIGKTISDPFISYIKAFKDYNKHVPKVYDLYEDKSNDWYFATMERLKENNDNKFVDDLKENNLLDYEIDMRGFLTELKDVALENKFILDLHSQNIMRRGDTLVITDPFACFDSSEGYVPGVDEWIDDFFSEMNYGR